jgi:hypothetical protein
VRGPIADDLYSRTLGLRADKLLLMNDLINNVLVRYNSFRKGDRSATAEIDPA